MNIVDRIFKMEEINGGGICDTYLYRWTLLQPKFLKGFGIYLHHFVGDDWSRDLHDHPKRFISIGLWGRYIEETPDMYGTGTDPRLFTAPWIRSFPATHIHRLSLINKKPCWTLVIVLTAVREWGFWHDGKWIHWHTYVRGTGRETAEKMKSCP